MAMSDLPKGWEATMLNELLISLESGSRPKGGVRGIKKGTPSIGGEHLKYDGTFDFSSIKYVPEEFANAMTKGHIQTVDILIVKDGATTGKTSFVDGSFPFKEAFVNEHVFICRPSKLIEPRFLFRFLMSKDGQDRILENFQGSAQGGINLSFAPNTEIPLAPLNEQRRVVAKLEKLLHRVDTCKERLEKIPTILKRFRQSVLAAACSGRLTEDWSEINSSSNWTDIGLIDIAKELKTGPFGSTLHKSDYVRGKVPVVNPMNIVGRKIVPSSDMTINEETRKRLAKYILREGDIVIARRGEMGRCAVVTSKESGWLCGTGSAILRLKETASSEYLQLVISSPEIRSHLSDASVGTTMENLNQKLFGAMPISLPPLPEQKEIIRRVEALFKKADEIEARYKKAKAFVDRPTQSILAKAFRGELVPQDPNDEPASELLKRIREERVAGEVKIEAEKRNRKEKFLKNNIN
jgi:type I restriction enzyme S subunit